MTLTATLSPPKPGATFKWDFDNDGVFDTQPSPDPTVTHLYPDEVAVSATVAVIWVIAPGEKKRWPSIVP